MQYINSQLPTDAYILFLFMGKRIYYCDRNCLFDMKKNKSVLQEIVKVADSSEYILDNLKKMGITHLLMNSNIFNKWSRESFDEREKALLQGFFQKHVETAYSQSGYALFNLKRFPS
jgi:hypothetical protein